jgi:hypothetical protein
MKITSIITVIRYLRAALVALPTALALISKIRAAFGNEKVQDVIKAFSAFIDKIAPPDPSADSTPVPPEREKRRRFLRLGNRLNIAGTIADNEVQEYCVQHQSQSVEPQQA